jgi:hypothetical protein
LRLDFAGLRGDASRYDVKQVCDCGCRLLMFRHVTKLCLCVNGAMIMLCMEPLSARMIKPL